MKGPAWDASLQAFFVFYLLYVPFRAIVFVFAQPTIAAGEALLQASRNNDHRRRMGRRGAVNADSAANSAANSAINSTANSANNSLRFVSRASSQHSVAAEGHMDGLARLSQRVYVDDDAGTDVTARAAKRELEPEAVAELRASLHKALERPQKGSDRAVGGANAPSAEPKVAWGPPAARQLPLTAGGGGGGGGDAEQRATHDAKAVEEGLAVTAV